MPTKNNDSAPADTSTPTKTVEAWAHAKAHIPPERGDHIAPWEYRCALFARRWEPTTEVTELEYDAAIADVTGITLG